jgi:hypothetical protein
MRSSGSAKAWTDDRLLLYSAAVHLVRSWSWLGHLASDLGGWWAARGSNPEPAD